METLDCGHPPSEHGPHTTGYGTGNDGKRYCFACCADRDREQMIRDGKTHLYFDGRIVSNWPGSLTFTPYSIRQSKHGGFGFGRRYPITHAWFWGPDGKRWLARQAGEWSQIAYCRRLSY